MSYMVGRDDKRTNNRTMFSALKENAAAGCKVPAKIELLKGAGCKVPAKIELLKGAGLLSVKVWEALLYYLIRF